MTIEELHTVIERLTKLAEGQSERIERLIYIAENHERRIERLEGGSQRSLQ